MKLFKFGILLLIISCRQDRRAVIKISGEAQGTTYSITWISAERQNYKTAFDSIFKKIDSSLSTYLPFSIVSRINNNDTLALPDEHFKNVFRKSEEVSEKTNGAFDVTIGPLVNAWGFGFTKKAKVDSQLIKNLLPFIGYKMVKLEGTRLVKEKKEIQLDFNAIAQGYTVDVLAFFLESKGIQDYLVELGGEVKSRGIKKNGELWKIGIDKPEENTNDERHLQAILELNNKALATSGNYRKFYVENGKKFSHILDPATGYPAKNNLLSASVIADDCMIADAYATAFMVMGLEKSKQFLEQHKELNLEVYFVFDENGVWKTFATENTRKWIKEIL